MDELVRSLAEKGDLSDAGLIRLMESEEYESGLAHQAAGVRKSVYGTDVYIRGLIEVSNYCKNNCYYCGIRRDNRGAVRYRLTKDEILSCCREGHELGFRTFVLQGGEDGHFTDGLAAGIVSEIRRRHPDCAITLSLGERPRESYRRLFEAGADRYLLRHETASPEHYKLLHPDGMNLESRRECLWDLKEIGFQVGSGFMVGSPFQTMEHLVSDLRFLQELRPDMIGIGPFIPHRATPFGEYGSGDLHLCLRLISILRLMFPWALIPSTTALGTVNPRGRELGLEAGANVVMPNLSPADVRKLYELYDDKIFSGSEAAECLDDLRQRVESIGYRIVTDAGHVRR